MNCCEVQRVNETGREVTKNRKRREAKEMR
jgi:hypothetical protein